MENLIHAIIRADKQAQQRLDEVEAKRRHIRKDAQAQKTGIEERYQREAQKRIDEHKASLANVLADAQVKKVSEYEETLTRLQETFHAKKETWIDAIVKRCQES